MASSNRIPIIVLAGSDTRPGSTPKGMSQDDMLTGPKGTIHLPSGKCLVAELVDRIRASHRFADPLLLGPRSWYEGKVDCEIVHVEGSLIDTLRQLVNTLDQRFAGHRPCAVTSCDILPSQEDLQHLLDHDYAPHADAMYWWQMVSATAEQMGASDWKRSYRLPLAKGQEPLSLYPGHLVIARPDALRFTLMNRLLELAYRYRNRMLKKRYMGITLGALGTLIALDIRNLASLQLPTLTLTIPYYGLRAYFRYRRGQATLQDVEDFLKRAFVHRRFHSAAGGRPVVVSVSSLVSFAKDIDTQVELDELEL